MHGGSIAEFIIGDKKYNSQFLTILQKLPISLKLWSRCAGYEILSYAYTFFIYMYILCAIRSWVWRKTWWRRWRIPWRITRGSSLSWGTNRGCSTLITLRTKRSGKSPNPSICFCSIIGLQNHEFMKIQKNEFITAHILSIKQDIYIQDML